MLFAWRLATISSTSTVLFPSAAMNKRCPFGSTSRWSILPLTSGIGIVATSASGGSPAACTNGAVPITKPMRACRNITSRSFLRLVERLGQSLERFAAQQRNLRYQMIRLHLRKDADCPIATIRFQRLVRRCDQRDLGLIHGRLLRRSVLDVLFIGDGFGLVHLAVGRIYHDLGKAISLHGVDS